MPTKPFSVREATSLAANPAQLKGARAIKRPFKFSLEDIAKARGKTKGGVAKDRQRGKFNPHDLLSLATYVTALKEGDPLFR